MCSPVERVAKYRTPRSSPTAASEGGSGAASGTSQEKVAYHWSTSRRMVTVLIFPWLGRCSVRLTSPTRGVRQVLLAQLPARLIGIGERVVAATPLVPGVAWRFPVLDPAEEGGKGFVQAA